MSRVLVGREAPEFSAEAVLGNGNIKQYVFKPSNKQYNIIFFYPLDFTFVCPSELIALDRRYQEFKRRGVEVIGVSVDSQFTHNAWRNTEISQGGIGPVQFTLVADVKHAICKAYGVEHPEAGVALRAVFLIDKKGIVRSQIVNDLPLGRNIEELLRLVDALQFTEKNGEVCPANWKFGDAGMRPTPEGVSAYLGEHYD